MDDPLRFIGHDERDKHAPPNLLFGGTARQPPNNGLSIAQRARQACPSNMGRDIWYFSYPLGGESLVVRLRYNE
jgi:hypothetical protein